MIYTALPVGQHSGWGVCSSYLTAELARLAPIASIPREGMDHEATFNGVMLRAARGHDHLPCGSVKGKRNIGYTFFELNRFAMAQAGNIPEHWDWFVTGSKWCENWLREVGVRNVSTVIQGVDHSIFQPNGQRRTEYRDAFVVFSGGCFQFRKGQDAVIAAMKVMMQRHKDVILVAAWGNPYNREDGKTSMQASTLISYAGGSLSRACARNGLDMERTALLPLMPNPGMARIYHTTDIGVFPNRGEGGTNLVLMEYMACGKPVIATCATGQAEVLTEGNHIPVPWQPMEIGAGAECLADWAEPDLDGLIDSLERAYIKRDALKEIAAEGAASMKQWTWPKAAEQFLKLLKQWEV